LTQRISRPSCVDHRTGTTAEAGSDRPPNLPERDSREFPGRLKIISLVRTVKMQVKYAARESNPQPAD
jgi:hypothetical protein